ncbi:MAG: beta-lactamase family protein [Nitrososphaerales archaeon]|nr:beta-lactamase family protein [Nitrososphaerales archaeon]
MRRALGVIALVLTLTAAQLPLNLALPAQASSIPVTGPPAPGLGAFDTFMTNLMAQWGVPGGALAVVKDDRLVLAHGYGMADVEANQLVQPDSPFRIASVSKPITAAAIYLLVQQGKLSLSDKAFSILNDLQPPAGSTEDPRIQNITVQDLLWHAGGWNRDTTFDPMFQPTTWNAADATGTPRPASCSTVIRYMLGEPLQFTPGTYYDYSNFGYCVLGRIIEKISGVSYEQFVQQNVLAPFGITDMKIGHTQLSQRAPREVKYYDPVDGNATSVFPGAGSVPWPYGGFCIEAMDAHGGWIASPIDLMRFVVGLDGQGSTTLLNATTMQTMLSRPTIPYWAGSAYWDAGAWNVRPAGPDANWWHLGLLPGTNTEVVRDNKGIGVDFAVFFNGSVANETNFETAMDSGLQNVVANVANWPNQDLFGLYGSSMTTTSSTTTMSNTTSTASSVTSTLGSSITSTTSSTTTVSATSNTAQISTSSFSTSSSTTTSSPTQGGGEGIPEFPFQVAATTLFTLLLLASYLLARRYALLGQFRRR